MVDCSLPFGARLSAIDLCVRAAPAYFVMPDPRCLECMLDDANLICVCAKGRLTVCVQVLPIILASHPSKARLLFANRALVALQHAAWFGVLLCRQISEYLAVLTSFSGRLQ